MKRRALYAIAALAAVALAALAWLWLRPPTLHGTFLQANDGPRNFDLRTVDGNSLSLADLRGKWVLLYFGYTSCPDVCPTSLADLHQMREKLGRRADDVVVVMVTVDPERDTPERLRQYLAAFDPSFVGFWGDEAQVTDAATRFGIYFAKNETEGASGYLMDHTSIVSVLDKEGRLRYIFPYGVSGEDMAADMRWLMN